MNTPQNNYRKLLLIVTTVLSSTLVSNRAMGADAIFELDAGADRETDGTFVFDTIPSNSSTDFANGKTFTVLDGSSHDVSGTIDHLTDGLGQTNGDSCCGPDSESFFAGPTGAEDNLRIQLDLEVNVPIAEINSYSWHNNSRAPQIYNVYGAINPNNNAPDFDAAGFQESADLAALGYTLIASVDSMSLGGAGGQVGVSITGDVGTYRYLLFDIAPPTWQVGTRATFFGEIDVVPAGPVSVPFKITEFHYNSELETVTLTWDSIPKTSYAVKYSTNMEDWDSDLDDGVKADDGDTTTSTFDVRGLASASGKLFLRIERN
ncbi:MAG: hypothetical protein P8M04_12805 [Akkermansiaceae bacterium]|nr:hypothetical protein [Akkermansiaceae bacterium]